MKPAFVVFEGTEGAGKTTLLRKLQEYLEQQDKEIVYVREPGTGPVGTAIRKILLGLDGPTLSVTTNALLFAAAYRHTLHNHIIPALDSGKFVLSDRINISASVYQSESKHIDYLVNLNTELRKPDVVFIMVTDHAVLERRMQNRSPTEINWRDLIGSDEHNRLKQGYLEYAEKNSDICVILDTNKTPDELLVDVLARLKTLSM